MRRFVIALLIGMALAATLGGASRAQKKDKLQCEVVAPGERNWELGRDYVYFDSLLCPPDMKPATPLVRVWITSAGNGYAVEKWSASRDGADLVHVFFGKKKAYSLYRDLDAVPLSLFKAERRSAVAPEMAREPFMFEGTTLAPFENLEPESAERARKVFKNADVLIKQAELKAAPLRESHRILEIVDTLERPLKIAP